MTLNTINVRTLIISTSPIISSGEIRIQADFRLAPVLSCKIQSHGWQTSSLVVWLCRKKAKNESFPEASTWTSLAVQYLFFACLWGLALFDYWHITKEEKICSFLPSPSLTYTHSTPIPFCFLVLLFFFVIHLCNEDMAQLASPMELNKRLIIQSSLAPKDYIHMRFPLKGTGEKNRKIIN